MSKSIQLKDINNEKYYPHPYYPVGSIYLSVVNTNPSKWFGGTWSLIAQGRTLVGVDTNDTNFNTVKKTGGQKSVSYTPAGSNSELAQFNTGSTTLTIDQIPAHDHSLGNVWKQVSGYGHVNVGSTTGANKCDIASTTVVTGGGKGHTHTVKKHTHTFTGTKATITTLPPYFTCYIWCRTA